MSKKVLIIPAVGVGLLSVGFLGMPVNAATTANTTITASVGKKIECTGMANASISEITPGEAGTANITIGAKTNSTSGFTITAGSMPTLTSSESKTIAMNTSAAAGVQGWKGVVTTSGEWSTTLGTGNTIKEGSIWTNAGPQDTENIEITVGTTDDTASGSYTGTISWTCAAK